MHVALSVTSLFPVATAAITQMGMVNKTPGWRVQSTKISRIPVQNRLITETDFFRNFIFKILVSLVMLSFCGNSEVRQIFCTIGQFHSASLGFRCHSPHQGLKVGGNRPLSVFIVSLISCLLKHGVYGYSSSSRERGSHDTGVTQKLILSANI